MEVSTRAPILLDTLPRNIIFILRRFIVFEQVQIPGFSGRCYRLVEGYIDSPI